MPDMYRVTICCGKTDPPLGLVNRFEVPARSFKPALFRVLRRIGLSRRDCVRAMWQGGVGGRMRAD